MYIFPFLPCTYVIAFEKIQKYLKEFVGISSANSHETSLVQLDDQGFKGIVAYAKCICDYYDHELGF